jgi:NAD(P)H-quinone oxidoreductase subunit 5
MSDRTAWRLGLAALATAAICAAAALPTLTPLKGVMLLLITGIGGITLRFARRYLDRAPRIPRFVAWYLATVTAAALVVLTDNLVALALAWTATSLSLHQLLTFAEGRPAAEVAAHKKFLLSRIADLAVGAAVILFIRAFGTASLPDILTQGAAMRVLPTEVVVAAVLLTGGVILRSAQLPFHGWLIQVMEAPTPVSALLHAGIVNLGAYVMIATGPLVGRVAAAQTLLLLVGAFTAVGASLVLLTRGSIKGALAWSTCAQMGFVLFECGLGAYDLALLHLLAHALYKANAFLGSGGTVARRAVRAPRASAPGAMRWTMAFLLAALLVGGVAALTWGDAATRPAMLVGAVILTLALVPTLATGLRRDAWRTPVLIAVGTPLAYGLWHALLTPLVPALPPLVAATAAVIIATCAFLALFAVQLTLIERPHDATLRAVYPHAVAGFHLDDLFTRLTFRVWPPRLTPLRPESRMATPALVIERAA